MTDSDSGENKYFAVPCSKNTGTKTMQVHNVDKKVGIATSFAPATIDWREAVRASQRGARCFR